DFSSKTISIPISNDGLVEGLETFSVTLSTPSGAALGKLKTVVVSLIDPFAVNNTMPVGWTVSSGANAGWSIATDQALEGTYSLKSNPIGNLQKAQIEVSKLFLAGSLTFSRKVSSEGSADFLRFYIDGVLQQSWTGLLDWNTFSFPISAGQHTLRWSYEKNNANAFGSDAAWIDGVVLPPFIVAPAAPIINGLAASHGSAIVSFTAPTNNGGSPITGYTATCSATGKITKTATASGSPITVRGLIGGVVYACSVVATNAIGSGTSSATLQVTPLRAKTNLAPILLMLL
ncbi:MAG: fibronectin type III domain-containing protein, partial [Pseudomonadota bacterium]